VREQRDMEKCDMGEARRSGHMRVCDSDVHVFVIPAKAGIHFVASGEEHNGFRPSPE